jgi:hypothetical protein
MAAKDISGNLVKDFSIGPLELQKKLSTYTSWPELMNDRKRNPELEKIFLSSFRTCDELALSLHEHHWLNYKPLDILTELEKFTEELKDRKVVMSTI